MLLDALTYLIDADNSKLNKEVDKSEKKVDDLGKEMTTAEKRAKDMQEKMVTYFKGVGTAILGAVAASKLISESIAFAQTAESIRNTSLALGVAVEDIDAFGRSIELMGGDAQGARDSLTDMAEAIGESLADTESSRAQIFKKLGISLKDTEGKAKDAVEVISELAGAVEGMGKEKAVFNIKQLGITDNRTVELILKGRQELERMMRVQKEQGVITKESAEKAHEYTLAMARFRQGTNSSVQAVASIVLPILTKLVNGFSSIVEWMNRHSDFIKGFFIAIGAVITWAYLPAVISAAVATWALIAPFLAAAAPIIALGVAFGLIYDDIVNFMEGNDSLIGQILEKYPVIGEILEKLKQAFFEGLDAGKKLASGLIDTFTAMAAGIKSIFTGIINFVKGVWDYIVGIYDKSVGMVGKIGSWIGLGGPDTSDATAQLSAAQANPLNSATSNSISNSSSRQETNVAVGTVNVQTQATDASGIAGGIKDGLKDQLKDLQSEAASGVVK